MRKEKEDIKPDILHEAERQLELLTRGTVQVLPKGDLKHKLIHSLLTGEPLKVKLGVDPTAPDIHLGHTVVLQKLKQFQDLGHTAMLLIGDFTASIGDPSGRNKTRPPLTKKEIQYNASTYLQQAFKVLDEEKTQLLRNSTWSSPLKFADIIRLLSQVTVSQILQREDFTTRYEEGLPIAMHELLYPVMQGYDSVMMEADIELGGTDQTFNCLMGRDMQHAAGQKQQVVMTLPLLEGTDGEKKMSKSIGNYIGLTDAPSDTFGKIMSIPDELMGKYFDLLTGIGPEERPAHPMDAKKELARVLITRYHSETAAFQAQKDFETRFSQREIPEDLPELTVHFTKKAVGLAALMVQAGFTKSNGEGIRLIKQNAVKINGDAVNDPSYTLDGTNPTPPFVLQAGKRRMVRVLKG